MSQRNHWAFTLTLRFTFSNHHIITPPTLLYPNFCIEWLRQDVQLLYHHCRQDQQWCGLLLKFCHKHVQIDLIFPSHVLIRFAPAWLITQISFSILLLICALQYMPSIVFISFSLYFSCFNHTFTNR